MSAHVCFAGLRWCGSHPKWRVVRTGFYTYQPWTVLPPSPAGGISYRAATRDEAMAMIPPAQPKAVQAQGASV